LNAADEVAVAAFLEEKIGFDDIPRIVEDVITATSTADLESIQEVLALDIEARRVALEVVKQRSQTGSPIRAIS
jgi:1-deoxy-D-xylulose-5-phosphate reductoisomerase